MLPRKKNNLVIPKTIPAYKELDFITYLKLNRIYSGCMGLASGIGIGSFATGVGLVADVISESVTQGFGSLLGISPDSVRSMAGMGLLVGGVVLKSAVVIKARYDYVTAQEVLIIMNGIGGVYRDMKGNYIGSYLDMDKRISDLEQTLIGPEPHFYLAQLSDKFNEICAEFESYGNGLRSLQLEEQIENGKELNEINRFKQQLENEKGYEEILMEQFKARVVSIKKKLDQLLNQKDLLCTLKPEMNLNDIEEDVEVVVEKLAPSLSSNSFFTEPRKTFLLKTESRENLGKSKSLSMYN